MVKVVGIPAGTGTSFRRMKMEKREADLTGHERYGAVDRGGVAENRSSSNSQLEAGREDGGMKMSSGGAGAHEMWVS